MNDVQEKLLKYRKAKLDREIDQASVFAVNDKSITNDKEQIVQNEPQLMFYDAWAIDFLNIYPMRKWREFSTAFPLQCWVCTGCVWLAGQLLFVQIEFGLVYFLLSCFMFMFLNLGVRKEGELSAYSVFNVNCERLLGQITSEHFERDMLRRGL